MFHWVYQVSDGQFLSGGPCNPTPGAGQGLVTLSRNPHPRYERYDGAGGIRPATAQETADYDDTQTVERALARFDNEKLVKALALWTAGKLNVPLAAAKQEILAILRGL